MLASSLLAAALCAVTVPNGDVPPGAPASFHGNRLLAASVPGVITQDSMKFMWFGAGVPPQPLSIFGRNLEMGLTPMSVLRVHDAFTTSVNEGYVEGMPRGTRFWSSSVTFPTEGCWEVTGRVGRVRLSLVVLVQTISSSSSSVK
jgi:hypothetical protein